VTATAAPNGPVNNQAVRIHLVYPHGNRISTPDAIGRELGRRLETRYKVMYHDWSERDAIVPEPGDVLLGHPHLDPNTVFRLSVQLDGWQRRLMMLPFNHRDLRQVAFTRSIVPKCDLFLAITGPHWFQTLENSRCSHWAPKMIHLDLAIDRHDYPPMKTSFGAPGKRKVVYVGHTYEYKNTSYLSEIAALVPGAEFAWIGYGPRTIPGLTPLGIVEFDTVAGRDLVSGFDFMLTVGKADANPTTILEAMAWGLIPVCTPTSGYEGMSGIANVPLGDAPAAAAILRGLLAADDSELLAIQSENWRQLDRHYTWDRFAAQVMDAIESAESPPLLHEPLGRRLAFAFYDLTSAYGRWGRLASKASRRWHRLRDARTLGRRRRGVSGNG
jgi:glycosyltransferase involved in cell wall biosynthesis